MQEKAFEKTYICKISRWACPQTPLEAATFSTERVSLFSFKRGWNVWWSDVWTGPN